MKTLLSVALLVIISITASAQISAVKETTKETVIGKLKPLGFLKVELSYTTTQTDTIYVFKFKDSKYTKIDVYQTIIFSGSNNTLAEFYKAIKSVFSDENKDNKDFTVQFKIGADNVTVKKSKSFGQSIVTIMIDANGGFIQLTEKEIDKIFDRK